MSSETSTDAPVPAATLVHPWQLFAIAGLLGASLVVLVGKGQSLPAVILLSLLTFAAAAVGLAAIRTFVPLTGTGVRAITQVLGGRTRAALEREKALVLRSIKELEFDKAMGKVSDKDFAEMSGRLRARAAGLLRQLDAGVSYRQQIEAEVSRRVGSAGGRSPEPDAPNATERLCASCGTANDLDAKFCKSCGSRMAS